MTSPEADRNPRRKPGVGLRRSSQENLLHDGAGDRICAANDTAVALWELCDGVTTVEEMVEAIRQVWNVDPATVTGDVIRALSALADVGAITWKGESRGGPV